MFDFIPGTDHFSFWGMIYALIELVGIGLAVWQVLYARTSRAAVAWAISLVAFPLVAIPLFVVFRRRKFEGYVEARREGDNRISDDIRQFINNISDCTFAVGSEHSHLETLQEMVHLPFTCHNHARLLINGENTFSAIFEAIDSAKEYILVQFFIVHDDELGKKLKDKLIARAKEGVKIYFLFDAIGSYDLPMGYVVEMQKHDIFVNQFASSAKVRRIQVNFRNHRKLVIVDGHVAFVGGHNVGDEYLGKNKKLSPWRDTHVEIKGPAVQCLQVPFVEDWFWAANFIPDLIWTSEKDSGSYSSLMFPTGPADRFDTCALFFIHLINSAKKRFWVASPYFVPDNQLMTALLLAALRGVDVRIMLPDKPDHLLVYYARHDYYEALQEAGVKIFIYKKGFLHQKVLLIDKDIATVGTANFDNRSFRLNFEQTCLFVSEEFAREVEQMLNEDFENCEKLSPFILSRKPLWFRIMVKTGRLFSPVL